MDEKINPVGCPSLVLVFNEDERAIFVMRATRKGHSFREIASYPTMTGE